MKVWLRTLLHVFAEGIFENEDIAFDDGIALNHCLNFFLI